LADILSDLGGQSWITGTDVEIFSGFGDSVTHVDFSKPLGPAGDATTLQPNA
jgi:hypothetical protein